MPSLSVDLGPARLATPLIAASGTVGSVTEFRGSVDFSLYGAAVAKSVAPEPWPGRRPPRLAPVGVGMLNGIGIQNPGIDAWLTDTAPGLAAVPTDVWGSVVAHDIDGFSTVADKMHRSDVGAIEVNLSCPNLDGRPFALDPVLSGLVVGAVRSVTDKPLGAKLTADAQPVTAVAAAVLEAGADWVVMGNTVMGAAIDVDTRRPRTSGLVAGYSGEPIRPIAMRCVIEIARDLPDAVIVGCGGASRAEHVIEYVLAGAHAVAIGSAHFRRPRVARSLLGGIARYLDRHGVESIGELRGAYLPWT